jgi:hypothetical protein
VKVGKIISAEYRLQSAKCKVKALPLLPFLLIRMKKQESDRQITINADYRLQSAK